MNYEQLRKDMEAGTQGDWVATFTPDLSTYVCVDNENHDMIASVSTVGIADPRRIARVPQLERIALAAEAIVKAWDDHDLTMCLSAIDAYREATK